MPAGPIWAAAPTTDDIADAAWFLTLLAVPGPLAVDPLPRSYQAKDLLRAARLTALPRENAGVHKWLGRLHDGVEIPPVLIMAGSLDRPLIIAEGFHRVCACYIHDEQTPVECFLLTG